MASGSMTFRLLGALAVVATLAACGDRPGLGASRGVPLENFTAEEIYKRAEYDLNNGDADDAAQLFGEIERLYPYSEWAKRALSPIRRKIMTMEPGIS